jgi:thiol-disulfide isomerase/thioredoxin
MMMQTIRQFLWLLLLGSSLAVAESPGTGSPAVKIPYASDFSRDAQLARERHLPIMVVVVADHCPYCTLLEEEFIRPMLISGDYDNKVIIRTVDINRGSTLVNFDGSSIEPEVFAAKRGVFVTPTLLFLGPDGKELVKRMIGINTVEMYGFYLDEAIDNSRARLRSRSSLAVNH